MRSSNAVYLSRSSTHYAYQPAIIFSLHASLPERVGLAADAMALPLLLEQAPAGWKGDETREKQVLNALFPIMSRDRGDAGHF